ncbi:MAG: hypothetical protein E7559_01610 [Ruminococcaceae bacterium]|nr:hypothetical protein [Oscillospiraceae bacterium]
MIKFCTRCGVEFVSGVCPNCGKTLEMQEQERNRAETKSHNTAKSRKSNQQHNSANIPSSQSYENSPPRRYIKIDIVWLLVGTIVILAATLAVLLISNSCNGLNSSCLAGQNPAIHQDDDSNMGTQVSSSSLTGQAALQPTTNRTYKNAKCSYYDPAKSYSVDDCILFGAYEQDDDFSNGSEAIEWRVLDCESNKILIISEYCLDCVSYNETREYTTWKTSSLRHWLNDDFKNSAFSAEEQAYICTVENETQENPWHDDTDGGGNTEDQIFCLSINEVKKYFSNQKGILEGESVVTDRLALATDYALGNGSFSHDEYDMTWWWLRSPGYDNQHATLINCNGDFVEYYYFIDSKHGSVRPALWLCKQT